MNFQQYTSPWSSLPLGNSGLDMEQAGCFVTSATIIGSLAGYSVTPETVCRYLNLHKGFTQDGSAYWGVLSQAIPTFRILGQVPGWTGYRMIQGKRDNLYHWWVQDPDGNVYDPWTGNSTHPAGYFVDGTFLAVQIDRVPVKVTVISSQGGQVFETFQTDLQPYTVQPANADPEVVRMQQYLTAKGFFVDAGAQDGWYGPKTAKAVHNFQVAKGLTGMTEYGWWYSNTRAKANADLSSTTNVS